jgi:hypothetical protein
MSCLRRLALVLTLAATMGNARAAEPRKAAAPSTQREEAQRRYERARELYDEGDFRASLVEFQRAYELAPSYRLLYNIAQVQYQLQDYAGALGSFQRYLQEGQKDLTPERRGEVQREVERLRSRVALLDITTVPAGAEVSVDDVPVGRTPLKEKVLVSAGRRKVSAELPGHAPISRMVDVAGADTVPVELALIPMSAEPVATPAAEASHPLEVAGTARTAAASPRGVPWKAWTATGTLAIGAGVTGLLAMKASKDLKTRRDTFGVTRAQLDDARGKARTLALTSDILTGATVVAAGISAWLTFSGSGSPAPSASASASSMHVGVGLGAVSVSGAF